MDFYSDLNGLTADIVSAYVSNNQVAPEQLPSLISSVRNALLSAFDQADAED